MNNNKLRVVILSGAICSGKSALAKSLVEKHHAKIIGTRDLILQAKPKTKNNRKSLQRAGDKLDKETKCRWVAEALIETLSRDQKGQTPSGLFVLDSVRKKGQIDAIRSAYGADVHHIHVTADQEELQRRYEIRASGHDQPVPYQQAKRNRTEKNIEKLSDFADVVVSTDKCSEQAVLVRATALLGLYPRSNAELIDVIIGGQYGSEGKGNIVGHIAPEYDLLVRVGGPNAGHKVYADPKPEAYFHLPSGSERAPNAKLLLGAGAVIYPPKLLEEIAEHQTRQR